MKQMIVVVLLGLLSASSACAQKGDDMMRKSIPSTPKVTHKYLLAHGFKEMPDEPGVFVREHVRLGDVLDDLGIPLALLCPTVNQPSHSDVRTANANGLYVLVRSEVRNSKGRITEHSLDDPNAVSTVQVSFQGPEHEFLKTDSSPGMRIQSVLVSEDQSEPLQVDFELSATGKKPVAVLQSNFHVYLTGGNIPPHTGVGFSFPEKTPQTIIVSPGKPAMFRLSVAVADLVGILSPGEYALRIRIGEIKRREPQRFNYEWEGREHWSNEYKFVVK